MPTNAVADVQFDFFLLESQSDSLWLASEVRTFNVDAADLPPHHSVELESTIHVEDGDIDSRQAETTDWQPTSQYHTAVRSDQSQLTLSSRDEHLPLPSAAEYKSLSTDDGWGSDEAQDDYDLQVDQPTELRRAYYYDDVIGGTYDASSNHQRQSSTLSETHVTSSKLWTSSSTSGTEASTSPSGNLRPRQINPPLAMHFADYVRQMSTMSERITISSPPPQTPSLSTTSARSARRKTGSQFDIINPSLRETSLMTSDRRTSTSNRSSRCGRRRCPRFRPGVRRQFCQAHFGWSITNTIIGISFSWREIDKNPQSIYS